MVVLVQVFQLHIFGVVLSYLFFAVMMCILNGLAIRRHSVFLRISLRFPSILALVRAGIVDADSAEDGKPGKLWNGF